MSHTDLIQSDSDAELSLSFHHVAELDDMVDILRRACDVLSLSNVECLVIFFFSQNQFIDWSEVFQHCTEVTTVQVVGRGTIGLLQALTPQKRANTAARGKGGKSKCGGKGKGSAGAQVRYVDIDNHGPGPMHIPIFPKLTSLLLEMVYFSDTVPGSGALCDLVMDAVKRRKEHKTPLTTLCIDNCVIREEQAKALEEVVPEFRWDGRLDYHVFYTGWGYDMGNGIVG